MRILVLDYARSEGGGNTISNSIIEELRSDCNNQWLIITSRFEIKSTRNLFNIQVPWIKKSLLHRNIFEKILLKKIIHFFKPDIIFSLQNLLVPNYLGKQMIYLHQALPFIDKKSKYIDKNLKFLLLKIILHKHIKMSNFVIVQTNYMKNLIYHKTNAEIIQIYPNIFNESPEFHKEAINFIYPTNSQKYKRFDLVLNTARSLKSLSISSEILITLKGDENLDIKKMNQQIKHEELPIKFIGKKNLEEMKVIYRNNHLLFASEVESLGLPLIEAMHYGCKIFAYNTSFAKEVTENYPNTILFEEEDIGERLKLFFKLPDINYGKNLKHISLVNELRNKKIID